MSNNSEPIRFTLRQMFVAIGVLAGVLALAMNAPRLFQWKVCEWEFSDGHRLALYAARIGDDGRRSMHYEIRDGRGHIVRPSQFIMSYDNSVEIVADRFRAFEFSDGRIIWQVKEGGVWESVICHKPDKNEIYSMAKWLTDKPYVLDVALGKLVPPIYP